MPTPTYRRPLRRVTSNGAEIPRVFGARIVRGWDQMLARADITVPYPPPAGLGKGAKVTISGGVTSMPLRFTGFCTGYGAELFPGTWTFPAEDALWLTTFYRPSTTHDLSNKTDQAAIIYIFTLMGLVFNPGAILGTGKKIGSNASAALTWGPDTTALEMIRRIDEVSIVDHGGGHLTQFRTWADFGGQIRRSEIANLPGTTAARTFTEGIDLEAGSARVTSREPSTSVTAIGDGVSSVVVGTNPWAVTPNPWSYLYTMLQQSSGADLTTALVAQFMLQRLNLNLVSIDFKTPRDDLIGPLETVGFDSDHVRLTLNAFVQSVETGWFEDGEFSQQLTLISARELNTNTTVTPGSPGSGIGPSAIGPPAQFDPFDGSVIPPAAPIVIPPIPDTVTAAFEVLYVDVELVLIADVETLLYTAVCRDTSTASGGTIATRAWTTTGGATPATGSDVSFNPSWTDLTGASVTLEVEDSLGNTDTITIAISQAMGVPVRTQDLFAAETDALAAFQGSTRTWRTYTTGITAATVVANGPLWAQGDTVYRSSDYLATAPASSVPAAGVNVTCIWTELDLDANAVAAGLANGKVAFSSDGAATWTVKAGPDEPSPVLKVILSRFNPGQVHAITAGGYYLSSDAGNSWGLLRAGDYRDLDLNQFRSWAIEVTGGVGGMIEAVSGSAITGSGADDLVAVTSHILADRGYAAAADGSAYHLATDGATALTAGTAVPAGTPQHRGMYRTAAADIVLAAVGTGGVVKRTGPATWYYLRKPGVAGAGSGPFIMVGAGLLATPAPGGGALALINFALGTGVMGRATGGAWSRAAGVEPPMRTGTLSGVAIAADNHSRMYAAQAGAVNPALFYTSSDGGENWTLVTPSPSWGRTPGFLVSPADGEVYAAVANTAPENQGGVWRSTDNAVSWAKIATVLGSGVQCIDYSSSRIFYTTPSSTNPYWYAGRDGSGATNITDVSGSAFETHIRAFSDSLAIGIGSSRGIFKLVPGSASVTITPSGLDSSNSYFGDVEIIDANTYLAFVLDTVANIDRIYRTTDAGSNWTVVSEFAVGLGPSATGLFQHPLAALRSNRQLVAAHGRCSTTYQQDILISNNGGASWTVEKNTADESDGAGGFIMSQPGLLAAP